MTITVNLWSQKAGELKRFLDSFYNSEGTVDNDAERWIYVCRKPLDAVDFISALIDNNDKFQIGMGININEETMHPVTIENHNDIIKGMFQLFYEDHVAGEDQETGSCI